ncbi:helix-turn-helix transcriptional regulator [Shewanella abyssi]|uniref:AraC family transcriptional regulator n=1 Tax=Shewanella abyssi TaxID=311789 RepID=UPI00200C97C7|nr:helix-turn-helix transcriptional regulator [Shewanella abyssi]MCL1051897.1 helix-turn-helix transcriptional regulator [Shewanella abyssi]
MKLSPSKESFEPLAKPIVLVKRRLNKGTEIEPHHHDWGQLLYAHRGVITVKTDSVKYICPAEQAVWLPPHIEHEVSVLTDCELSSFYFDRQQILTLPSYSQVIGISPLLKMLIVEALNISASYAWQSVAGRHLRLIRDFIAIAPAVETSLPSPTSEKLLRIALQLNQRPDDNKSIEEWGALLGASARTLSRNFKKETGISYTSWRQRLKVQIAINLLHQGLPVTEVAFQLGYQSPSAFIYMFKQNTGMTPSNITNQSRQ